MSGGFLSQDEIAVGVERGGFLVRKVTPLPDLRMTAYELEHPASGAKVLHLHTGDAENLFSIQFMTPPPDDSGLPHILEHAVLAGSRRYPVKEPFFEMCKMSLATFINAMTGWECTYYPVCSMVPKDLMNLADVYFDAVFHPLLEERTLRREGHHLSPANGRDTTEGFKFSGVVYSEMKGVYSDPEAILHMRVARGLFPDTPYRLESGGDPRSIPLLTYERFLEFHRTHYHPGNAWFVLYGNLETAKYLDFLGARLTGFTRQAGRPILPLQPRWREPRLLVDTYPVGADESAAGKTYLALSWLTGDGTDPRDAALEFILSCILMGNEAAPLRKALVASRLGEDTLYHGFTTVGRETAFLIGLKGSEEDRLARFEAVVLETLAKLADGGISREMVETAFQQSAYHYQEILPLYPLHMMDRVMSAWVFGRDPLAFVRMHAWLGECRAAYEKDTGCFGREIRKRLLDNPHRLRMVLKPDRGWQARWDQEESGRVKGVTAGLSADAAEELARAALELEEDAARPNPPEKVALLPQLKVSDVPRVPSRIPTAVERIGDGVDLLVNDVFANGVNYIQLQFDLSGLPEDLWVYLPRYADAFRKMGCVGIGYEDMARRTASCTGGISCSTSVLTHVSDAGRGVWGLRIGLKSLDEPFEKALDVLNDLLFTLDPGQTERMGEVLLQSRAGCRSAMVHDGQNTAVRHACRGVNVEGRLLDLLGGLPQLRSLDGLTRDAALGAAEVAGRIGRIQAHLLSGCGLVASFTGSESSGALFKKALRGWMGKRSRPCGRERGQGVAGGATPRAEGLAGPVQVGHCVCAMRAPHLSDPDEGLLMVGSRIVSMDYLLPAVRFKGNAYGAGCQYDPARSLLVMSSYRDPNPGATLDVFEKAAEFVSGSAWTQEEIDRAIIGTAKSEETPIRPGDATATALVRHVIGATDEYRAQRYGRILSATPAGVRAALLRMLEEGMPAARVCVMAGRETLDAINTQLVEEKRLVVQDIMEEGR